MCGVKQIHKSAPHLTMSLVLYRVAATQSPRYTRPSLNESHLAESFSNPNLLAPVTVPNVETVYVPVRANVNCVVVQLTTV